MQTIMPLEACCNCGQPIGPDEPRMQSASVDIDDYGRVFSSTVKSIHITGPCHEDARRSERAEREARLASLKAE